MALTKDDLEQLSRPFPANAHKFDYNKNVYLHEVPISERLESVDPSWAWVVKSVDVRPNAGQGGMDVATVTAIVSMTVCGVTRENVGMNVIQKTKSGTSEANQGEKAAVTDAFKRVARMFGVGRYLLTIPKNQYGKSIVSNLAELERWLKATYGELPKGAEYHDDDSPSLELDDYISEEDKPAQLQTPKPDSNGGNEQFTDILEVIESRTNNAKKRYYIAGGCTFFSRDVFRDLGFSDTTLENLEATSKTTVLMSEKFRIAYTENAKGYKTPLRVQRIETGKVVEVKKGS